MSWEQWIPDKEQEVNPVDFEGWMAVAMQSMNMTVEEFWKMPLFMFNRLADKISSKEQPPSRKEYLVGYKDRKKRFGWV